MIRSARELQDKYDLDNSWRVTYTPTIGDFDEVISVHFIVEQETNGEFDQEFRGWVKWDGCSDWGFGEPLRLHCCGAADLTIFSLIYRKCEELIGGFR